MVATVEALGRVSEGIEAEMVVCCVMMREVVSLWDGWSLFIASLPVLIALPWVGNVGVWLLSFAVSE